MNNKEIILESLSPIERDVLPNISKEFLNIDEIATKSARDKTTALRALTFLKDKELVEVKEEEKEIVELGILGLNYFKKHLPERVLLNRLSEKKSIPIGEIKNVCELNDNEAKIALGTLKKKALVEIKEGKVVLDAEPEEVTKKMFEEKLLEKLPCELKSLEAEDKFALENLKSRKDIIQVSKRKIVEVKLTALGKEISTMKGEDLVEQLTPKMLKQNSWKGKKFRRYNLTTQVPKVYGGKRHFVNQATDYAKSIWLEMGFKEMTGDMVQTGLWNFDALFTAQDHPVREMQDTFFLKDIEGNLPEFGRKDRNFVEEIKKAHEKGLDGSKGWQYNWNEKDAKKVVLRPHTTCLSAKKLKEIGENKEFPTKYFALGKCFRNETVDWSHGFEFNQTEGIVVDENANFRQLLGYLKEFFKKMGYEKLRIRPGYFPYTEPSLEIDVFHPIHKKWVELGGAGMFRPEVTIPFFGRHIPVLAWGPCFD
ncbi:MAG: phenylalanine--tRNA ligase subunit alpha [Nanoarchaeota archaeon]|nr:phenylalanine--tRNA ligase subunit alpha [Nanoarchaeota archaeon]